MRMLFFLWSWSRVSWRSYGPVLSLSVVLLGKCTFLVLFFKNSIPCWIYLLRDARSHRGAAEVDGEPGDARPRVAAPEVHHKGREDVTVTP